MIKKISHIAIVVPKLEQATSFWAEALELNVSHQELVSDQGVSVAFIPVGESDIELLEPIDPTSGVARYLEKRGPGMHHICFEVDDMDATLARLKAANVPLINEEPTMSADGKKIAFVHPKGTNGVLVELYELPVTVQSTESGEDVRQRLREGLRDGRNIYTAGAKAFLSGIRHGRQPENT
ncbi:MAG: methylmalonyl-CoA epimerase [Anaerolineae bacterium]|nr:methylmalonyl-CoA epimerase [Anaerolineae bacterium]